MKDLVDTLKDATNTMKDATNTMKDATNTINDANNTIKVHTNSQEHLPKLNQIMKQSSLFGQSPPQTFLKAQTPNSIINNSFTA